MIWRTPGDNPEDIHHLNMQADNTCRENKNNHLIRFPGSVAGNYDVSNRCTELLEGGAHPRRHRPDLRLKHRFGWGGKGAEGPDASSPIGWRAWGWRANSRTTRSTMVIHDAELPGEHVGEGCPASIQFDTQWLFWQWLQFILTSDITKNDMSLLCTFSTSWGLLVL